MVVVVVEVHMEVVDLEEEGLEEGEEERIV